jgi:hypothetical protein
VNNKQREAFVAGASYFAEGKVWQLHEVEAEALRRYPDTPPAPSATWDLRGAAGDLLGRV